LKPYFCIHYNMMGVLMDIKLYVHLLYMGNKKKSQKNKSCENKPILILDYLWEIHGYED